MVTVKNMSSSEFEERIKYQKVIAFCCGQDFEKICKKYKSLFPQIIYIVDNYKCGDNYNGIPIVSMTQIDACVKDAILIISSSRYAKDIVCQMDEIVLLDGLEVYIPFFFKGEESSIDIDRNCTQCIPKKIHYCWFGNGEMPEQFKKNIESWQKYCPDYEIIRWDESNYDYKKNLYMKQAYEAKKWGFVPDYARLDIINTYGGIYLDTDVELLKPLDDLLSYQLFCGFESATYVAFGLGFGAKSNHPILQEMMQVYDEIKFLGDDGNLNLLASPTYQTNVLKKHGLVQNGESQMHDNYMVFSSEFFAPINAYGVGVPTHNSYSIHQYAATWYDEEQKKELNVIRNNIKYIQERINQNR